MKWERLRRLAVWMGSGLLALVALVAVAWTLGLLPQDSSEAASVEQALDDFRSEHGGGGQGQRRSPIEGVYLYATEGHESIDALGGANHTYPATTTITVIRSGCGLELRWRALQGRSTTWTLCASAAGMELLRSDERHSFYGRSDHTTYGCEGRVLLPRRGPKGTSSFRCRSGRATQKGETHTLGAERLEVDGKPVSIIHSRTSLEIEGEDDGREVIDWWLDSESALPVRLALRSRTSRPLFVGRVHYSEDFVLRLISLRPRR